MISLNGLNVLIAAGTSALIGYAVAHYYKDKFTKQRFLKAAIAASALLTFVITFGVAKELLAPWYQRWYLLSTLRENPLLETIEKNHPQDYQALMQKLEQTIKHPQDKQVLINYSYYLTQHIFLISLKSASDEIIHDYLYSLVNLYNFLKKQSPQLVYKYEYADPSFSLDVQYLMEEPDFKRKLNNANISKRNIIISAIRSPVSKFDQENALIFFKKILLLSQNKFGSEAVMAAFNPTNMTIDPKLRAEILLYFYQTLLNSNQQYAGQVMRYIGSLNAKSH